jgi:translation initiation factor IF-3
LFRPLRAPICWNTRNKEQAITEPRINDRIRVPEVRLVGPGGEQVGIVKLEMALRLAAESDLDLVEVAPDAHPPVAKLMDYGKFKYESAQKARGARRNQANMVLKEIRFRLKIDPHDYGTKKGHVERFLNQGDKVKVMIMFRGREQSRPEMGIRLLQRLAEDVAELGTVESSPRQDGRNMVMVLAPIKKKAVRPTTRKRSRGEDREVEPDPGAGFDAPPAVPAAVAPKSAPPVAPAALETPAPAAPAVSKPVAASKPAPIKPAAVKPAAAKPAAVKPTTARSAATKPTAAAKPATAKTPVTPKPAAKTAEVTEKEVPAASATTPTKAPAAPKPKAPAPKPRAKAPSSRTKSAAAPSKAAASVDKTTKES